MDHSQHCDHGSHEKEAEDHSGHDMGAMDHSQMDHSQMDHSGHSMGNDKSAPGAAPESAVPARALEGPRHAADAIWGEDAMAPSRKNLAKENGGMQTGMVLVGFDPAQVDEILGLKEKGLRSVLLLPLGYREEEGDWLVNLKKVRRPLDSFVTNID